jgi:hypothetical protein
MVAFKIQAEIGPDGKLQVEVPGGLPAGKAEVLIVVQSEGMNGYIKTSIDNRGARSGLFAGKSTQSLDADAALNEMNNAWQSKFAK